jgi:hypothetical protein
MRSRVQFSLSLQKIKPNPETSGFFLPRELSYTEEYATKGEAGNREKEIKRKKAGGISNGYWKANLVRASRCISGRSRVQFPISLHENPPTRDHAGLLLLSVHNFKTKVIEADDCYFVVHSELTMKFDRCTLCYVDNFMNILKINELKMVR